MPEYSTQDTSTHELDSSENLLDIPEVGQFVADVDRVVEEQITDDVIEARLREVRTRAKAQLGAGMPSQSGSVEELARYGYTMVRLWLQVLKIEMEGAAAAGGGRIRLTEEGIHDLAKDTTARAISATRKEGLRDLDLKTAFLSQCLRKLPEADRSRRLRSRPLIDTFDNDGADSRPDAGNDLVAGLRHAFVDRAEKTAHLVRNWADSDEERRDIVSLTQRALAVAMQPEARCWTSTTDEGQQG